MLQGAQDAARKLGYILLTANTNNDAELEDQEISALRRYNVDGFLYAMMYHRKVDIPEVLEGSLTVVVDGEDAAGKVPSIYPDDEMAGHDATNRLIRRMQTHRLLRFHNHYYRAGGASGWLSACACGSWHCIR
ncbi:MAG: hypothetical protein ACLS6O_03140 [Bifidobacterium sp.]